MNFSIIEITNTDFQIDNCKVYHYRNQDDFRINIFFLEGNCDTIDESWKRFSNMVAANYQNSEYMGDNKFDKWNFYIIYISKDVISKELKNKIENDKFSSRKIVDDVYNKEFNNEGANNLIVKHITNADLKEIVEATHEVSIAAYVPNNTKLWELLVKEEKVIGDRNAQEEFIKKINAL